MALADTRGIVNQSELERLGFIRGNPFATMEADQERAILDELFVDIDNFERIRAAQTVIVHAPKGCGKSAARVRLTNSLAPWTNRPDVDAFAIELLNFDSLVSKNKVGPESAARGTEIASHGQENTALTYVDVLLHLGAETIFPFLFAPGSPNPRLDRLQGAGLVRLGRLVWGYAPELLYPENIYERLVELLSNPRLAWAGFRKALNERRVSDFLGAQALEGSPQAAGLAFLLDLQPEDREWKLPEPTERLALLVNLVQRMGFHRLEVMVDRVDEIQATANDAGLQAGLLEPLLAHLPLMEMPGVSFKFFIPTETRDALLMRKSVRTDRLDIVEATVDWSETRLKRLLARRLAYFSNGLPDFSQNTSTRRSDRPDGEEHLSEAIEREMILLAAHSPRRLIRAGQLLLNAYLARPDADLLTWADWVKARDEMMGEEAGGDVDEAVLLHASVEIPSPQGGSVEEGQARSSGVTSQGLPVLYISKKTPFMRLKGRNITLSETEVKIIRALTARSGNIDEEDLVDEVWGAVITTAGVDVALKRIRDEIDRILGMKKSGLKYYLLKKSGTVMLMNYQLEE